jgi:tetratricopeptide (TPR) repeat protein
LRNAAKIRPDDHELKFNIGLTLYESEKYEEALEELMPVVKARPDDDSLLYTISLIFLNLDREFEALEYLTYAVQSNPQIKDRAVKDDKFKQLLYSNEEYRSIIS